MTRPTNTAEISAGLSTMPTDQVADRLIASLGGDARVAVTELVAIVGALLEENKALAACASRGFARSDPFQQLILKLP